MTEGVQGPTQEELLNATSPEALSALEAKYSAEPAPKDEPAAPASDEPTQTADAAPAPAAAAPAPEGAPSGADSSELQGVATKSGKGVLPYRVLEDEREQKKAWRDRAATLEQQLQEAQTRLQALEASATGAEVDDALGDMTEDEIEDAAREFPVLRKMANALKATAQAAKRAATASTPPAPAPAVDPQEAADEAAAAALAAMQDKPLLMRALNAGGVLWSRVVELDKAVAAEAGFAGKTLAERAAEVQTRLSAELGVPVTTPKAASAPPPAPLPEPTPIRPNTLSDLQGGRAGPHDPISEDEDGAALARRFLSMTPEQIEQALRRSA